MPFALEEDDTSIFIPAEHFLNRNLLQGIDDHDRSTWIQRARPDTSSLAAADFDVNVKTGFLPSEEPIRRLEEAIGGNWNKLEIALELVQSEIAKLAEAAVGQISESCRSHIRGVSTTSFSAIHQCDRVLTSCLPFFALKFHLSGQSSFPCVS